VAAPAPRAAGAHVQQRDDVGGRTEGIGDDAVAGERGDERAVLLGDQHVAGERALRVEPGEALEGIAVGASGGSDHDGWIEVLHVGSP
jgi:hypothetical protein